MTTTFASLPILDLSVLHDQNPNTLSTLSKQLHDIFATTGFAYLTNAPLSFNSEDVFSLAREFFLLPSADKMKVAKRSFQPENSNTYRGQRDPHAALPGCNGGLGGARLFGNMGAGAISAGFVGGEYWGFNGGRLWGEVCGDDASGEEA
ncbi:hypothetical protein FE257_009657 [Aspergillus nanangensis]|uniref:Non-haem dioxygenase N-terminal domain-containing protein n=1 Tax=Aspergillus nanangensis TaxID=2582783 RepID=A0AAD4CJI4_ASPNN|nr:hypothetical protein FE257_009657 [Aspergillus nanangensis]